MPDRVTYTFILRCIPPLPDVVQMREWTLDTKRPWERVMTSHRRHGGHQVLAMILGVAFNFVSPVKLVSADLISEGDLRVQTGREGRREEGREAGMAVGRQGQREAGRKTRREGR